MGLTDNETIKAMRCCEHFACEKGCPLKNTYYCISTLKNEAFHLMKRQKAEIERLNTIIRDNFLDTNKQILEAQDEAIKEFAERLKAHEFEIVTHWCGVKRYDKVVDVTTIDNLLKEMVGE